MKLAIYTTATTGYTHALTAQARRIIAAIHATKRLASQEHEVLFILVTDKEESVAETKAVYERAFQKAEGSTLPRGYVSVIAESRFGTNFENYKVESQLLIAQMRTAATVRAWEFGADFCLSLDGDVLPPSNALRSMFDMLDFDDGYYSVAFCPYPSHGGGLFLGGRGTPQNPILPDFYEDEKDVPVDLISERDNLLELLKDPALEAQTIHDRLHEIEKEIRDLPPKLGVFGANAKRWRQRGWFDNAYPAIGRGAVVPVDWTGCGCTLMNKEALALCDWVGYDGRGTEDLFLNFRKWHPAGIRMVCIPHCPCDHVVRHPSKKGQYVHIMTGHETAGECVGHLRQWPVPFYPHAPGDRHDPDNDGRMSHPAPPKKEAKPTVTVKKRKPLKI